MRRPASRRPPNGSRHVRISVRPQHPLAAFGDPATAARTGTRPETGAIACHRVHMPSAGTFGVRLSDEQNVSWSVYDDAGTTVCPGYGQHSCHVGGAGDYSVITRAT